MLSQIEPGDNGIGTAAVTENRCNGFIKSPTISVNYSYSNSFRTENRVVGFMRAWTRGAGCWKRRYRLKQGVKPTCKASLNCLHRDKRALVFVELNAVLTV